MSSGLMFNNIIMNIIRNKVVEWHSEGVDSYFTNIKNNTIYMYKGVTSRHFLEEMYSWKSIADKVVCHPVYKLYVKAEHSPGTKRSMRWWDQDVVNEPEE